MCAKLSAQLWCHSYGAITTKSPILSNINLPSANQHCKTQNTKSIIHRKLDQICKIEVSPAAEAVAWMLQWMWPLFPGCDWILTFQQVTKYHILEILPQNVKVLELTKSLFNCTLLLLFHVLTDIVLRPSHDFLLPVDHFQFMISMPTFTFLSAFFSVNKLKPQNFHFSQKSHLFSNQEP